jgi:PBSX family phage portal protein
MAKSIESIPVEVRDKSNKTHSAILKATIFDPYDGKVPTAPFVTGSNAESIDVWQSLAGGNASILTPPYSLEWLAMAVDNSNELGQNIRAIVTNTVGFGFRLRELPTPGERVAVESEIIAERVRLLNSLANVHPKESLRAIRNKIKHDKWLTGNGFMELIENAAGELVGLNHVHAHTVRLAALDDEPVIVDMARFGGQQMAVKFRRFVQMVGNKLVYFKEPGDPRVLDKYTGMFAQPDQIIPLANRATSLLHHKIYCPYSAYGVPVWIGNIFSYHGSRAAEEINMRTLTSNAVPSYFLIVENGVLTSASIDRIREFIQVQADAAMNYSRCVLLEGEPLDEGNPNPGSFKIKIEPVKRLQQTDELFQDYDKNNREKLRQSFRLPPMFLGNVEGYNRATADVSRAVTDEQVFAPDREEDDELFNRFVMSAWGAKYHRFHSLNPNITNDPELIRMMGIAEKSGAMTPRRADALARDVFGEELGPMPKGVDPDVPYSLQFAHAQKTGGIVADGQAQANAEPASDLVENLIKLRKRIEYEIDTRFEPGRSDD